MSTAVQQPSLWDVPDRATSSVQKCHFKGCTEPVVGSSSKRDAYVCKHHNEIEWATALSRGKDGYWKMFGKRWLEKLAQEASR